MPNNLNSGYGLSLADKIMGSPITSPSGGSASYPTGGKSFLVCPTAHPNYAVLSEMFIPDPDGLVRFYTTLTAALAAVTANRGDVIYIAEGYTESETGATTDLNVNVAGVRILGLGDGANRPTFNFTTAVGAVFTVSAANVDIQNCIFTVGFDDVTSMVSVTAADVNFYDCVFNTNNGTQGAAIGILTATATRFGVHNCFFLGPATNTGTTTTAQIDHEAGVDYLIENSYFTGKCTQNITNGATILRGEIRNNRFVTYTGTKSINMASASTPFITNNRFNVPSGTAPIVAAAGFVAGNVYSAAAGVTAGTASTF